MYILWLWIIIFTIFALMLVIIPLTKQRYTLLFAVILGFFLIVVPPLLYLYLGDNRGLYQRYKTEKQVALVKKEIAQFGSVENIIKMLQQRLQKDPNSAEGWYLLGKLYLNQQEFDKAISALDKANSLKPNDVNIMEKYAESIFIGNHQKLNGVARNLLLRVLKISPQNIDALNMLAWDAYQHKNYQVAIISWQKILSLLPPQNEAVDAIKAMIQKAKEK